MDTVCVAGAECRALNETVGITAFTMEVGNYYDVAFSTGRYEIEYENRVKCVKVTPKSYRIERPDGSTRLVGHDSILELKRVSPITGEVLKKWILG